MKYKTQMEAAKNGCITDEMKLVAEKEHMDAEALQMRVALGTVAIPANRNHATLSAEGIGEGLRTKVNVNLGISGDCINYELEMQKARLALDFGCESIMDLSNYGKTNQFRKQLIGISGAMIGTVPIYDAAGYLEKDLQDISAGDFLKVVEAHAKEGVDFMTIHAGMNRRAAECFKREKRLTNIVSRGGALLFAWMELTGNENPFYQYYDELLEILREYDVTISLGDALRPGSIADSTDASQIGELVELGSLTKRAWEKDVQVMVEGPGHMALNEIAANVTLQKRLCHGAPFYVLGPLVTDISPGYDHITAAIGGAVAAASGADFLCYVTPAEHLRLPDLNDVKEGIAASRIAAHAADIAKGIPYSREVDNRMSDARRRIDWEEMFRNAIDPEKARRYFKSTPPSDEHSCSMCGKMCAMKTTNEILEGKRIEAERGIIAKAAGLIGTVRERVPLIHQITNYVTVGDCANATLAIGASPIMADDISETEEITGISSALVINMGTLNERTVASMIASGKQANRLGIPVVFDPVGAGASKLRNETANTILDQVKISILRGNLSEISYVEGQAASTRGVDVSASDAEKDGASIARAVSKKYNCVTAITGPVDIVSDGERTIMICNGVPMLSKVTGTGCVTTALVAAFAGVTKDYVAAAVCGISAMGIAGEIAYEQSGKQGTGSFRIALTDALSLLDRETIEKRLKLNEG